MPEDDAPCFRVGQFNPVANTGDIPACRGVGFGVTMAANRSPKEERPLTTTGDPNAIYCVKCKARTESADLKPVTMKNGRAAAQATCVVCGTRKFRIGAIRQQ